ncbi:MAG: YggS family pyridoxal phosphate-dependent enzyme [Limnobacter sp.]|nr:YggS family pyridoxal phosphate-dependent enzyme [Limnobacter sp.]
MATQRLAAIEQRIQQACDKAGRNRASVHLLAVSKTFPLEAVLDMAAAGQTRFGENYLQESIDKITQLAASPNQAGLQTPLEWHFIGPIQSNKTRPIAEHFDWVHSVDRLKIAQRLSEQRPDRLGPLNVLIQVNTSGEDSKSGVHPAEVEALALAIQQLPRLQLRGLMTIPSNTDDMVKLRGEFLLCADLQKKLQLDTLSMGMSSDLELAIECGSTCVRVGTALFGQRT